METNYDVLIVGGGPAGLAAALALGRARKRVLLCDSGQRRNAKAAQVHNFVTRDGTPPDEFRSIGRAQLELYPSVEMCDERVETIGGVSGAFEVHFSDRNVVARRIVLATGMIDELPNIEGFQALWGTSIFQCPYCHGWEVQDRRFGYLASSVEMLIFPHILRGWSSDVVVFTNAAFAIPADVRTRLEKAGIPIEERAIARLASDGGHLTEVEFKEGPPTPCEVLFAHPKQHQVSLVQALGLALNPQGFVQVDDMHRETSTRGIHAAGDLTTPMQAAIAAAAAGTFAAAMLNHALLLEGTTPA